MSGKKQGVGATRLAVRPVATVVTVESAPAMAAPSSAPVTATETPPQWGMIYLLARIFYAMRSRTEDGLKPFGLTPMQSTILATLKRWDGLSSAELSRRFGVTPQTMGEMIANLERRLLVARRQDPANRRALKLTLTPEGRKMVRLCDDALEAVEGEMFKSLSERELKQLQRQLMTLHDDMGLRADLE